MAVMVSGWAFLFMGKEKVTFRKEGFGYSFRMVRGYLIVLTIFSVLALLLTVLGGEVTETLPLQLLNTILVGAFVANPDSALGGSYVDTAGQNSVQQLIYYGVFILIMIPMLVKCIRDIQENDAVPFEDDFRPRAVAYQK